MVKTVSRKSLNSKKIIQLGGGELICPSDISAAIPAQGTAPTNAIALISKIINTDTTLSTEAIKVLVNEYMNSSDAAILEDHGKSYSITLSSNITGSEPMRAFVERLKTKLAEELVANQDLTGRKIAVLINEVNNPVSIESINALAIMTLEESVAYCTISPLDAEKML